MNPAVSTPPPVPAPTQSPRRLNWIAFLALLLGPAVLTSVAAFADHNSDAAPAFALIGGALGGIGCGVLLGRRLGQSLSRRVVLGLVFSALCTVACITISTFGCLAGGYQLDLR